ncbi:HEAT repeat domain-containing protein [bacterium]|nr:HEAT repeat domain-containing protein [bacterium]
MKKIVLIKSILILSLFSSPLLSKEKNFLLYETTKSPISSFGDRILLPYFYPLETKETDIMQYKEIFSFLALKKSDLYATSKIIETPEAQKKLSTDAILTVEIGTSDKKYQKEIISEMIYTFTEYGISKVLFIIDGKEQLLSRADISFTTFTLQIEMWRALPPIKLEHALILLPNKQIMKGDEFYQLLDKSDKKMVEFITQTIQNGEKLEKIAAMKSLSYLKIKDSDKYLIPFLAQNDKTLLLAALEGLSGTKKPEILSQIAKKTEEENSSEVLLAASNIFIASGDPKFVSKGLSFFLKYDDIDAKIDVIKKISLYKNSEIMLSLMLDDQNEKIKLMVLEYLKSATKKESFEKIKTLLNDKSEAVSLLASNILFTQPQYKKFALYHQIKNSDPKISFQAAELLKDYKEIETQESLINCLKTQKNTQTAIQCGKTSLLLKYTDATIPTFDFALKNSEDGVVETLNGFISLYNEKTIIPLLENKNPLLLKYVLIDLSKKYVGKKDLSIIEKVGVFLTHESEIVRVEAVKTLTSISGKESWLKIATVSKDNSEKVRKAILESAYKYSKEEVQELLTSYISDSSNEIRVAAIRGLIDFKVTDAIPLLEQYITSSIRAIKITSLEALVKLSSKIPMEMEQKFLDLLEQDDSEIKMWAIYGLAKTLKRTTLPFITIYGQDNDPKVRQAVVYAIGELNYSEKTKIDMIYSAMDEESIDIQKEAALALGKIGQKEDIEKVKELITKEKNSDVKKILQSSLSEIEGRYRED